VIKSAMYWLSTGLLSAAMLSGGIAELILRPETLRGMSELGYPAYFVQLLGFWKVLGVAALLVPRFPRLKEWAYAGIFFNMTGAAFSHVATGSAAWHLSVTLSFALLTLVSWLLRPSERKLGQLPFQSGSVEVRTNSYAAA
jgi:uncharacterized membrane protein